MELTLDQLLFLTLIVRGGWSAMRTTMDQYNLSDPEVDAMLQSLITAELVTVDGVKYKPTQKGLERISFALR